MTQNTINWSSFPTPIENGKMNTREELEVVRQQVEKEAEVGFVEGIQNFMGFIEDVKAEGFFMAVYDKPFSVLFMETWQAIGHAIGVFILGNGDILFLLPAIVFMAGTFVVGKNKFTKWIIPCWFFYFLSRVFFRMII